MTIDSNEFSPGEGKSRLHELFEAAKAKDEFEREVTRPPELPRKTPEELKAAHDYEVAQDHGYTAPRAYHSEVAQDEIAQASPEITIEEPPGKQEHKPTVS